LTRDDIILDRTCVPLQGQTAFEREAEAPLAACQNHEEWVERERERETALWVLYEESFGQLSSTVAIYITGHILVCFSRFEISV